MILYLISYKIIIKIKLTLVNAKFSNDCLKETSVLFIFNLIKFC